MPRILRPWTQDRQENGKNTWKAHENIAKMPFTAKQYEYIYMQVLPELMNKCPKIHLHMSAVEALMCVMRFLGQDVNDIKRAIKKGECCISFGGTEHDLECHIFKILEFSMDDMRDIYWTYFFAMNINEHAIDNCDLPINMLHYMFPKSQASNLCGMATGSLPSAFEQWWAIDDIMSTMEPDDKSKCSVYTTVRLIEQTLALLDCNVQKNQIGAEMKREFDFQNLLCTNLHSMLSRCADSALERLQYSKDREIQYGPEFTSHDSAVIYAACVEKLLHSAITVAMSGSIPGLSCNTYMLWQGKHNIIGKAMTVEREKAPKGRYDLDEFMNRAELGRDPTQWFEPAECGQLVASSKVENAVSAAPNAEQAQSI